jgi:GT2 family glycosyltransferase
LKAEIQISVIIVNWNGRHYLEECLNALRKQTLKQFETILIDNGSHDGSVSWVRKTFPWVRVIDLPRNTGFCYANNLGYAASRGKYIALLNNDTRADSNWLYSLTNKMEKDERIGICASRILLFDKPEFLDAAGDGYDFSGVGFRRGHGAMASSFARCEQVFGACAAAASYRKSMLDEIGFFDEDFFAIGEDIDLSFRAKLAGYKCVYVPEALVYHKVSGTIGVESNFQVYQSRRNVEYVYFRNMPIVLIYLTFPVHILYNLLTLIHAIMNRKLTCFLKAKRDFLLHFTNVRQKRIEIQRRRKISLSDLFFSFSRTYLLRRTQRGVAQSGLKR